MNTKTAENKRAYQQKLETNLQVFQAQIDRMKAMVAYAKADAKPQYHGNLEALRAKQQETQSKLYELKAASEDAWQELKIGAEVAMLELQDAFNIALAEFKNFSF